MKPFFFLRGNIVPSTGLAQKGKFLSLMAAILLSSCEVPDPMLEPCVGTCNEAAINAPVDGSQAPTSSSLELVEPLKGSPVVGDPENYRMPNFRSSWGLNRRIYEKAVRYHETNYSKIANPRFVSIVDFNQHSSKKRFYVFDLKTGLVERHNTTHGKNSDPDRDGYATNFSNEPGSLQSSLGFYFTLGTYTGNYGYSLRINGLESTNSNALKRAVVVHPWIHVSNSRGSAGLSWGCPALDPSISKSVIDRIKGGSLLLIDR